MGVFESQAEMVGLWAVAMLVWVDYVASPVMFKCCADWEWYNCIAKRVAGMPNHWIFGLVWSVLYVLITVSIFWFLRNGFDAFTDVDEHVRDALGFLILFNMMLKNMWSPTFFVMKETGYALLILILTWITAIIVLILFAMEGLWPSFGTWIFYAVWLTYAFYLNVAFISEEKKVQCGAPCGQDKPTCYTKTSINQEYVVNNHTAGSLFKANYQKKLQNMV